MKSLTHSLLRSIVFPPLVYFASGLTITGEKYLVFTIVFGAMDAIGSSLALLMVCAVPTLERSSISFTLITSLAGTACGFFLRPSFIPSWFSWLYYISWYKYAVDALYINQFKGVLFNGGKVLESIFSVDPGLDLWGNVGVLFMYPVIFHGLAYITTNRRKH